MTDQSKKALEGVGAIVDPSRKDNAKQVALSNIEHMSPYLNPPAIKGAIDASSDFVAGFVCGLVSTHDRNYDAVFSEFRRLYKQMKEKKKGNSWCMLNLRKPMKLKLLSKIVGRNKMRLVIGDKYSNYRVKFIVAKKPQHKSKHCIGKVIKYHQLDKTDKKKIIRIAIDVDKLHKKKWIKQWLALGSIFESCEEKDGGYEYIIIRVKSIKKGFAPWCDTTKLPKKKLLVKTKSNKK